MFSNNPPGATSKYKTKKMLVSTTNQIEGYKITGQLGIVRGVCVRKDSMPLFGGDEALHKQCEAALDEAYNKMVQNAETKQANAIIGMQFGSSDMYVSITQVLAYGTAVTVEKV